MKKLSERIRPGSEAAPWVCDEVKALEQRNADLELALQRVEAETKEACAKVADGIADLREAARNVSPEMHVKLAAGCAMDTAREIAAIIRATPQGQAAADAGDQKGAGNL